MAYFHLNPADEDHPNRIPDAELFYHEGGDDDPPGFYWWACFPGCHPDTEAVGPYDTAEQAVCEAQAWYLNL